MLLVAFVVLLSTYTQTFTTGFIIRGHHCSRVSNLVQAKKTVKKKVVGGGFGLKKAGPPPETRVGADKTCLERQWDRFVAITDLEISPSQTDDFDVVDVFVRTGGSEGSEGGRWFRVGKVTGEAGQAQAALKLQRGLIYWTAVQMHPALAVGGMQGAASLELGWTPPSLTGAAEGDGPVEAAGEGGIAIQLAAMEVSVKEVGIPTVGFRPDFSPRVFAYKRRERAGADKEKNKRREGVSREAAEAFERGDDGSFDPFFQ